MSRDRHCDESPDHCFEGPLLKRFSDMVSAHPDSIAIHSRDDAWTYACLAQRADWIAQSVVKTEGTATLPIYLLFDNTPDAIASMVACLKLGRPYVPLSSSMPSERLAHIRDNAQGSLFLTETSNLERAASFTQGQIPVLDIENLEQCISPSHPLPVVAPNTPAWILYTSGSTGTPKGVIQTHRNLLHYISIYTEKQALTSHDRVSLLSSYTANIASHDIFSALLNGATLCVYDVSISGLDPLADWIESTGITVFSCVPTLFRRFCREMDRHHAFQGLRFVKLIGEPVYQRDLEAFRERFPATCVFINRLGSSETGTIRWFCANPETMSEEPNVPVGYAVNDNEIMLLDEGGRPVPQGAVGEIVVRSPYLSPGYWRRPDLTAMAYGGDGDTRRFHTGDMGSMLPDGCLVHVGRKDSQIKIRGYRIETAEIEAALLRHPAIEDVLVMPREDHPNDRRLVAYYSTNPSTSDRPSSSGLRQLVASLLPEYMVPNAFVYMDTFPLAPNGKIRRGGLPPIGTERPLLDVAYAAPKTSIELSLAQMWKDLLHLELVGIRDSFFELGGHSLLTTRLLARIREQLKVDLTMRLVFEHPTIEDLAAEISQQAGRNNG